MDDTPRSEPPVVDDLSAFTAAFRRLAAGVSVITALDPDGTPRGFTATSVASLAAVPPMATFNMARIASAWPAIERTDRVILHILGARNAGLARTMSGPHDERFAGDHWAAGPHGLPLLSGVPAWMVGRIVARTPVEDNAVVVVRIEDGALGDEDDALVYHERGYHRPLLIDDRA